MSYSGKHRVPLDMKLERFREGGDTMPAKKAKKPTAKKGLPFGGKKAPPFKKGHK